MSPSRASVKVALYCVHEGCSEDVVVQATRIGAAGDFNVALPKGWSRAREDEGARRAAPYEVPAYCPAHRPDVRAFVARSLGEIADRIESLGDAGSTREVRGRLERYRRVVDAWKRVQPTAQQVTAMGDLVAELRGDVGLPPGLVSGMVARTRTPR